jgi:mono/diheme cytochrome c family protein
MIEYQLLHLNELKGFMPPFVGTDAERRALARWLQSLNPQPMMLEPTHPGVKAESQTTDAPEATKP